MKALIHEQHEILWEFGDTLGALDIMSDDVWDKFDDDLTIYWSDKRVVK